VTKAGAPVLRLSVNTFAESVWTAATSARLFFVCLLPVPAASLALRICLDDAVDGVQALALLTCLDDIVGEAQGDVFAISLTCLICLDGTTGEVQGDLVPLFGLLCLSFAPAPGAFCELQG